MDPDASTLRPPRASDRLAALGARLVASGVGWIPEALALALARLAGEILLRTQLGYVPRICAQHARLFGAPPRRPLRFARRFYRHLALLVVEFVRMPRLQRHRADVDTSALEALRRRFGTERALIVTAGHVGNWEWAGYLTALAGFPLHAVVRPLDNRPLDAWVRGHRGGSGMALHTKWNVLWGLKKTLDRGGVVAMNVDQFTRQNVRVGPFGLADAPTNAAIAQLHLMTRAPVIVGSVARLSERGGYRFEVWAVLESPAGDDWRDDAAQTRAVDRINAALVRGIRAHPAQWLWTHERWGPLELPGSRRARRDKRRRERRARRRSLGGRRGQ